MLAIAAAKRVYKEWLPAASNQTPKPGSHRHTARLFLVGDLDRLFPRQKRKKNTEYYVQPMHLKMGGFEELNEKRVRALSVLKDDLEQLALNAFGETTRLVGTIGEDMTRTLLLYTTAYHRDEVAPYLQQGMRLNVHLDRTLFQVHMDDIRQSKPTVTAPPWPADPSRLFIKEICQFVWLMETRLWESKVVCLRGLCAKGRDEIYLSVLRILEIRWRAYSMMPVDLREGGYPELVDDELNERWVRGLLPTAEAAAAVSGQMRAARGLAVGKVTDCHEMCDCDKMKKKANLWLYSPDSPDEMETNLVRQRQVIDVAATLPLEDVPDPEELVENLRFFFDDLLE